MSPEDQKYYEELFNTFSTPGWKLITAKWEEVEKTKDSIRTIIDGNYEQRKGELTMLNWMLNFEEDHRKVYDSLIDNADL